MALPYDIAPPAWLSNEVAWARGGEERDQQRALFDMKMQEGRQQMASNMLGMQEKQQGIQLNDIKIKNLSQDQTVIPNWLKEHPTWQSRQDASDWPTAMTPEGESQLTQVRLRDAQSVQQKVAIAGVSEFSKRVNELSKSDPIAGSQFAQYIGKVPPPVVLQALGVAEQALGVRQQNAKDQAALDAQSRGDVATTTINDKGVSTSYKPAPANSNASQFKPEDPISLEGGAQLIHVSPNRWQYVKGDTKTDLTPEQKRNVAHEILSLNAKDPRGLKILDELASMATKQPMKSSIASPTDALKVGRFTVIPQ